MWEKLSPMTAMPSKGCATAAPEKDILTASNTVASQPRGVHELSSHSDYSELETTDRYLDAVEGNKNNMWAIKNSNSRQTNCCQSRHRC